MTAPQKFTKRPVEVEAWQFVQYPNGNTSGEEIAAWCGGEYRKEAGAFNLLTHWVDVPGGDYDEGANIGDWVIKVAEGDFEVVPANDFAAEFEATS